MKVAGAPSLGGKRPCVTAPWLSSWGFLPALGASPQAGTSAHRPLTAAQTRPRETPRNQAGGRGLGSGEWRTVLTQV